MKPFAFAKPQNFYDKLNLKAIDGWTYRMQQIMVHHDILGSLAASSGECRNLHQIYLSWSSEGQTAFKKGLSFTC